MISLLLVASMVGFGATGRLENVFLPANSPSAFKSFSGSAFGQAQQSVAASFQNTEAYQSGAYSGAYQNGAYTGASFRQQSTQDGNAQILRANSDVNDNGYAYDFETSNGIRADQSASAVNGVQAQGSFAYKGDDGHDYSISYTADENGYQPRGDHLPTSPPIPEAILRSLEQNAREDAAGGSSDGSYHADTSSYNGDGGQYYGGAQQSTAFQPQVLANSALGQYQAPRQQSYNARIGYNY